MKTRTLPNFFIAGAAKCGTTALYDYLSQHPQVYMSPIKEPNYFATDIQHSHIRQNVKDRIELLNIERYISSDMRQRVHRAFIRNPQDYSALFRFADKEIAIGEASASYMWSMNAAAEIKKNIPDAKFIFLLRNPVERAYSHYLMDRRMAVTEDSFEIALEKDEANPVKSWGASSMYLELGMYYRQIKRFTDLFPPERILILLHEELLNQPEQTYQKVLDFLGLTVPGESNKGRVRNNAVVPRNRWVQKLIAIDYFRVIVRRSIQSKFIKKIIKGILFRRPGKDAQLKEETKIRLNSIFREDIHLLERLTGKDLRAWY